MGVPCKEISCPENSVGKFYNSLRKHSFAGSDAACLLGAWPLLLKAAFPESAWNPEHEDYDSSSADHDRFSKATAAWQYWAAEVWPLINNLELSKEDKASQVESKGRRFVELWVKAAGEDTKHLYPHMLTTHLPEQIRTLPVDPYYLQTGRGT